ncbi:hypothetical protein [Sphingorhabdus sp.]|jgi:hypothetical protein|uniref:hypothetical protein n=1 Tax=Sphingorhabdus sp. TaxID=1902408 RepID=UPI0037C89CB4
MTSVRSKFHACPKCAEPVPFSRSLLGRGKSFECKRCKRELIVPKVSILPFVTLFLPLSLFGKKILELENGLIIITLLVIASSLLEYLFLSVKMHGAPASEI